MSWWGLRHFAEQGPDEIAVIDRYDRVWSRGELFAASNRIARALRNAGLSRGDCIAVMAPNCVEYLQVYFAAMQIGLYFVSLNWHLARPEIAYIVADSGAKALVVQKKLVPLARDCLACADARPQVLVSIGGDEEFADLAEFAAGESSAALADPTPGRVLTYTSATTGRPKGVDLPLAGSEAAVERIIQVHMGCGIQLSDGNVHLCASMLYHAAPLDCATLALHMGHRLVLVDRWEPRLLLELIDKHRVTTTFMVPAMFVRMLKLPADVRSRYAVTSLRFAAHSAAPCPLEVKRRMIDWWGLVIWESYGSSEGSGTVVSSQEWLEYPGTVGRPIPGSRIKILDEDGVELPAGTAGLIYMTRYTGDRFRYRHDAEKTEAAYRGEFFTVGDIGRLDEEGYLFICDRKIDMIICGGINIYPAEIERVLVQHPQVADCAVFGIPDDLAGEAVKAVIQLQPGVEGTPALTVALLSFLGKQLSAAKLPRRIEYLSALPRDPNGKLYKRLLRGADWADRGRVI